MRLTRGPICPRKKKSAILLPPQDIAREKLSNSRVFRNQERTPEEVSAAVRDKGIDHKKICSVETSSNRGRGG